MQYRGLRPHDPSAGDLKTVTFWLIIVNVSIFVADLLIFRGGLENAGALYYPGVVYDGEYYRLLTYGFLHSSFSHLAYNMLSLFAIGFSVEEIFGHIRFAVIYFLSDILGGCFIFYMENRTGSYAITVGASGAIFSLMGALFAVILLNGRKLGSAYLKRQIWNILMACVFMFLPAASNSHISVTGHIGGFVSGLALGTLIWLISKNYEDRKKKQFQ